MIKSEFKVQSSTNPAVLTDTLNKLGYVLEADASVSDYYFCKDKTAYAVKAPVFSAIDAPEFTLGELLRQATLESNEQLPTGTVMAAENGYQTLLFTVVATIADGTYLGFGENKDGILGKDLYRYLKSKSRLATSKEIETFLIMLEAYGYNTTEKDGVIDISGLRWIGKDYYSIQIDFEKGAKINKFADHFSAEDNKRFVAKNMFPSEEKAREALKRIGICGE